MDKEWQDLHIKLDSNPQISSILTFRQIKLNNIHLESGYITIEYYDNKEIRHCHTIKMIKGLFVIIE